MPTVPSRLGIDVSGTDSLTRASQALGDADASLAVRIPEEMRLLAERLAAIAKRRVLDEPIFDVKQSGLRAVVSEGVDVRQNSPGDVTITTSMPQPDEAELPRGMDEPIRGWRHPVFGHMNNWVQQSDAFSWFLESMQGGQDDGQRALENLLNETADQIAAATA